MPRVAACSDPNGAGRLSTSFTSWFLLAGLYLVYSLALRISTFGHPNMDSDEAFYFLVGQAMHEGAIPYVDLWDRKPFGLFALYYLLAAISSSVIAYQIAAWLFVAATSLVICRIVTLLTGRTGGVLAGLVYPLMLPRLFGWGGQAPVFYNLPVALSALLVLLAMPALRADNVPREVYLSMALSAVAITIKQTAVFEAAFFGLFILWELKRSGASWPRVAKIGAICALIGAAPTLIISIAYWGIGHWPEYWQAMVLSNLAKKPATAVTLAARSIDVYLRIGPILIAAILGVWVPDRERLRSEYRGFVFGWLAAAILGFAAVPNLYPHYALPLLVPFSVAAGYFFARNWLGPIIFAAVAAICFWRFHFFDFERTRRAEARIASLTQAIKEHGAERGLLIFDGPVLLYRFSGQRPPSPLALPLHLNYSVEENVSHINTNAEVARILARKPGVVTVSLISRNNPRNELTTRMVLNYVAAHCHVVDIQGSSEMFRNDDIVVHGDCR